MSNYLNNGLVYSPVQNEADMEGIIMQENSNNPTSSLTYQQQNSFQQQDNYPQAQNYQQIQNYQQQQQQFQQRINYSIEHPVGKQFS
jgi:hypothetical protein